MKSLKLNRSKSYIIIYAFFLALITSCEPGVEYSLVIQNNSDFEVQILKNIGGWYIDEKGNTIYTPIDTVSISKNTSRTIFTEGGIGGVYDYVNCHFADTVPMLVYFIDSIKVIPNIKYMNDWNFKIIKKYKNDGGVCECRIILTNDILTED